MRLSEAGRRIKKLEAKRPKVAVGSGAKGENESLESYYRELESYELEQQGLPPLPYNEVDRRSDERFLTETLPALRESLGWQSPEAQQKLDATEEDVLRRLENGER